MDKIIDLLMQNYPIDIDHLDMVRDSGSAAYTVFANNQKYFLRALKPAFMDTALTAVGIQVFLQERGFPVPPVIFSRENTPYIQNEDGVYVLYEYIEGSESNPEQDAEAIGALTGRLHSIMKDYPGELVRRDKHFYMERYTDILKKRQYPRAAEFLEYGEALWEKIKDLPRGFCHGDLYCGNILKSPEGKLYMLDFDTSCNGFPMYDVTLICDMTEYFKFDLRNYDRSNRVLTRFLPDYMKYHSLSEEEIKAFHDLIAVQHFSTQATVMEIFGPDCLTDTDLDYQLNWLYQWREQCSNIIA